MMLNQKQQKKQKPILPVLIKEITRDGEAVYHLRVPSREVRTPDDYYDARSGLIDLKDRFVIEVFDPRGYYT